MSVSKFRYDEALVLTIQLLNTGYDEAYIAAKLAKNGFSSELIDEIIRVSQSAVSEKNLPMKQGTHQDLLPLLPLIMILATVTCTVSFVAYYIGTCFFFCR